MVVCEHSFVKHALLDFTFLYESIFVRILHISVLGEQFGKLNSSHKVQHTAVLAGVAPWRISGRII
jgi:hypothetical protein